MHRMRRILQRDEPGFIQFRRSRLRRLCISQRSHQPCSIRLAGSGLPLGLSLRQLGLFIRLCSLLELVDRVHTLLYILEYQARQPSIPFLEFLQS